MLIAARDEQRRIAATLAALSRGLPGAQLWLADDGSRDHTAAIAARMGAHVVGGDRRRGKGQAMSAAAAAALAPIDGENPLVLLCDADLGDSAVALAALCEPVAAGVCDLAVAAFADSPGGGLGLLRGFARRELRERGAGELRAPLSGQRALRAQTLAGLLPFAEGYGMELGMSIDALAAGIRLAEVELALEHRAHGRTPAGFLHRARQLRDARAACRARPRAAPSGDRGRALDRS